jgi:hypothetical protein
LLFRINKSLNNRFIFYILACYCTSCTHEKTELNPCENVDVNYTQSISPIIQTHCALSGCHNGDSTSVGNFSEYSEIKLRVDNGQFKIKVFDTQSMPPIGQPALTSEEFNKLKCWYDAGALNN